jgi:hypothetical protein
MVGLGMVMANALRPSSTALESAATPIPNSTRTARVWAVTPIDILLRANCGKQVSGYENTSKAVAPGYEKG